MARRRSGPNGISVTVRAGPELPPRKETRYVLALRRQAANRARRRNGKEPLPAIKAGRCRFCEGWGVVGTNRIQCPECGGDGR
jgi:hypothetical protein